MITYMVVPAADGTESFSVIVKESGVVVVSGLTRNMALAEANLRASQAPGNRVES